MHNRIRKRTADVIEIHVDPRGTQFLQFGMIIGRGFVIECGIETQRLRDELHLLIAARDADGPAPLNLGDLAHQRTYGPAGA